MDKEKPDKKKPNEYEPTSAESAQAFDLYQESLKYYKSKFKFVVPIFGVILALLGYFGYDLKGTKDAIFTSERKVDSLVAKIDTLQGFADSFSIKISTFDSTAKAKIHGLDSTGKEVANSIISKVIERGIKVSLVSENAKIALARAESTLGKVEKWDSSITELLEKRGNLDADFKEGIADLDSRTRDIERRKSFPIYLKTNTPTELQKFNLIIHIDGSEKEHGTSIGVKGLIIESLREKRVLIDLKEKDEVFYINSDEIVIDSFNIGGCLYTVKITPVYLFEQFIEHGLYLFNIETYLLVKNDAIDCPL